MEAAAIGWAVEPVVSKLIQNCISILQGPYKYFMNTKDNLEKLQFILTEILAILSQLDQHSIENQHQNLWLREIKYVVYDAEDLLDELEYRVKEAEVKKSKSTVSYLASSSSYFVKQLAGLDGLPIKLAKIVNKLERINSSALNFHQIRTGETNSTSGAQSYGIDSWNITGAVMGKDVETEIFGRVKEKDDIIKLLLEESETVNRSTPHIISIVGIGGIGKTTLAQLVYNDHNVTKCFDLKIWIYVSSNFDVIRLTREMLESMCNHDPMSIAMSRDAVTDVMPQENNLTTLQNKLQAKLQFKKLLLVLDDVWEDKDGKQLEHSVAWEKLVAPLKHESITYKILVTTRTSKVVGIFNTAHTVYLDGLCNTDSWLLLKHHAVGDMLPSNISELQKIGNEIAKRLNGSPLAARVIGATLKGKSDVNDWSELLEKDLSSEIMPVLKLSYVRLPEHLKPCFGYCSLFPKGWTFEPEDLVRHWVAHGFIQSMSKEFKEITKQGRIHFNDLLERSFFQTIRKDSTVTYVMHDLMHDLAESYSREESHRIDKKWEETGSIPWVRHLSIFIDEDDYESLGKIVAKSKKSWVLKKLRTLIVYISPKWTRRSFEIEELIRLSKNLRVLSLKKIQVRDSFDQLLHLRYLQFHFPYEFAELATPISQAFLHFSKKLYHLQAISVLKVSVNGSTTKIFEHFEARTLVTEAIVVSDTLLSGFSRDQILSWMEKEWFLNLRGIELIGLETLEHLPPLGELPLLNYLIIKEMPLIEHISEEFYRCNHNERDKVFPALETLLIINMPKLSKLSIIASYRLFPRLYYLKIIDCPELKSMEGLHFVVSVRWLRIRRCPKLKDNDKSALPSSLESLVIGYRGITDGWLSRWLEGLSSLFELAIWDCDQLVSLPSATVLQSLTALRKLYIKENKELASVDGLYILVSLEVLAIYECPRLKTLSSERLPSSIEGLWIWGCHPELMKQVKEKRGPEWDRISHIPEISTNNSNWPWKK